MLLCCELHLAVAEVDGGGHEGISRGEEAESDDGGPHLFVLGKRRCRGFRLSAPRNLGRQIQRYAEGTY